MFCAYLPALFLAATPAVHTDYLPALRQAQQL